MSNTKKYTAEEVARMIADRAAEIMKKHEISSEYMEQILEKSKNTAHEIDAGEEPNNDDAECPASLGGEGSSEKSESSEDVSMEDEPLQGDNDSDTEEEETEEDEDEEDEEDEYEFAKSEACGHVIEYKRLAKGTIKDFKTQLDQAKRDARARAKGSDSWSTRGSQKGVHRSIGSKSGNSLAGANAQYGNIEESKQRHAANLKELKEMPKPNLVQSEGGLEKAKVDEGLSDEEKRSKRRARVKQNYKYTFKPDHPKYRTVSEKGVHMPTNAEKRPDPKYEAYKDSNWTKEKSKQNTQWLKENKPNLPKSEDMDKCGEMTYKSESGMHTVEYKRLAKNRMATHQEMQEIRDKKQSNELWDKWNKKNKKFQEHQEKDNSREDFQRPRSVDDLAGQKKLAANEDSKVKETEGIEFDKEQDADKTNEENKGVKRPLEKCGEIKKEEMDKCGEMSSGKKLKKFLGKMKKPSPGMIQKPQE